MRITNQEIEIAREVLEKLSEYTQKEEPYATSFINAVEEVLLALPDEGIDTTEYQQ